MTRRTIAIRIAVVALLAAGATAAILLRDRIDFAAIETWIGGLGAAAPVVFAALFALGTILFLPGAAFGLIGGALFGPVWGSAINLGGATLGATAAFLLARYIASDWVTRRAAGRLAQLVSGVEAEGWRFVALIRLVPIVPFNLLNYALGLTRIRLFDYVAATLICMLPGTIAYTWLGHAGRNALAGDSAAIRYALAALGVLAAIALLPRLVRRFRAAPKSALEWIEVEALEARRLTGDGPAIVDVRGADEFNGPLGHIAGAINIPVDELPARLGELAKLRDRAVVLVCRTDRRSANAAGMLGGAGFSSPIVLRGGMTAWNERGLAVARDAAPDAGQAREAHA